MGLVLRRLDRPGLRNISGRYFTCWQGRVMGGAARYSDLVGIPSQWPDTAGMTTYVVVTFASLPFVAAFAQAIDEARRFLSTIVGLHYQLECFFEFILFSPSWS